MRARIPWAVTVAVFFILVHNGLCWAASSVDVVRQMLDEVIFIQTNPNLQGQGSRETRKVEIEKVIVRNFDFAHMAREALGPEWPKLSSPKKAEFSTCFQDLFLDSYSRLVLDFLKKEKIIYEQEDEQEENARVRTSIYRINERIPVDYSLTKADGTWLVSDVIIDGVSVVDNYRKSFSRVIQQESLDGLLRKMRLQQKAIQK